MTKENEMINLLILEDEQNFCNIIYYIQQIILENIFSHGKLMHEGRLETKERRIEQKNN